MPFTTYAPGKFLPCCSHNTGMESSSSSSCVYVAFFLQVFSLVTFWRAGDLLSIQLCNWFAADCGRWTTWGRTEQVWLLNRITLGGSRLLGACWGRWGFQHHFWCSVHSTPCRKGSSQPAVRRSCRTWHPVNITFRFFPACLEVFLSSIVTSNTFVLLFLGAFELDSELVLLLVCVSIAGSSSFSEVEGTRMGMSRKVWMWSDSLSSNHRGR